MRWRREAYLEMMNFGGCERPMFSELFGPLVGLDAEWRAQGASDAELAMTAFDWDYVPVARCGANTGAFGLPDPVLLEDTPAYRLERDGFGRTIKLDKAAATIPLPLDFPVRTMADWLRLKPHFLYCPERLDAARIAAAKEAKAAGELVVGSIPGGYDMVRALMGEVNGCLAFYDQPELIEDIFSTLRTTAVRVLEELTSQLELDQLSVHEDFAGKSGPLIGPGQIAAWLKPYYRAAWEVVHARGTTQFNLDTDGNINSVIDALLDCGLTTIHPMEPAAGMDIVALRRQYGSRLAMLGGIDKHVLRHGREAIRAELTRKLQPAVWQSGGTVLGLDHRIPNGTPLADYRFYVALGREMLGLPPLAPERNGWGRMAF